MSEDWAAVAKAINERVAELGLRQHELAKRADVSQAIVRELQHNTVQRRRSARTLEALSLALSWHPGHLTALLHRQTPPKLGEPVETDPVSKRLFAIEQRLQGISDRLDEMNDHLTAVIKDGRE